MGLVKDRSEVVRRKTWKMNVITSKRKEMKGPGRSEEYFQLFLWSSCPPHSFITLSWIQWGKKFPFFLMAIWIGFLSFSVRKFYTNMCQAVCYVLVTQRQKYGSCPEEPAFQWNNSVLSQWVTFIYIVATHTLSHF